MNIDKNLIGKPPNVAHVINDELTARSHDINGKLKLLVNRLLYDSREQLEADALELANKIWDSGCNYGKGNRNLKSCAWDEDDVIALLVRQATITEREFWDRMGPKYDELTAERDALKDVKNRLKRENEELKERNHELETAFERMDALLTQKQRVIDIQRESFRKLEYEITVLKKKGAM